jgi:hypothetical protein
VRLLKTLKTAPPEAWKAYVRRVAGTAVDGRRLCGRQTRGTFSRILGVLAGNGLAYPRGWFVMSGPGVDCKSIRELLIK